MACGSVQGKDAAVHTSVEYRNVEWRAQTQCLLRKGGYGLVGCIVELPDIYFLSWLQHFCGRQGIACRFTFGLVTDGNYQPLQAEVKELSRILHTYATVATGHDGCLAAEVDVASQEGRRTCRELPAKELACGLPSRA